MRRGFKIQSTRLSEKKDEGFDADRSDSEDPLGLSVLLRDTRREHRQSAIRARNVQLVRDKAFKEREGVRPGFKIESTGLSEKKDDGFDADRPDNDDPFGLFGV